MIRFHSFCIIVCWCVFMFRAPLYSGILLTFVQKFYLELHSWKRCEIILWLSVRLFPEKKRFSHRLLLYNKCFLLGVSYFCDARMILSKLGKTGIYRRLCLLSDIGKLKNRFPQLKIWIQPISLSTCPNHRRGGY